MKKKPQPRTPPVHHVEVSVEPSGCIVCSPDPVVVKSRNALLNFKLVSSGYTFREKEAIVVTRPGTDFPYPSWTVKPTHAALLDLDNDSASYAYSVYLVDQATGKVITGDPSISNEPD